MKNKVLVELIIPEIDASYNGGDKNFIYNRDTGSRYDINQIIKNTDIRNGSKIILI